MLFNLFEICTGIITSSDTVTTFAGFFCAFNCLLFHFVVRDVFTILLGYARILFYCVLI